jgi:L-cystine uptake protein TcyP (sodium:dicarboxylate symporter family)
MPEFNVALFAFLLNYPWEFLQVPFFDDMPTMPHWEAVVFCTRATLGDVLIALAAFWGVAALTRNRSWILQPTLRTVLLFVAIGVVITVGLEWHATEIDDRWQYADTMPTLPILGTGLLPLIQWLILPLLLIWLVRRQVRGQRALNNE